MLFYYQKLFFEKQFSSLISLSASLIHVKTKLEESELMTCAWGGKEDELKKDER